MARSQSIPRAEDLLTINEACALLGISRNTLYTWINKGYLDLWKVGGSSRIDKAQIQTKLIRRAVAS